MSWGHVLIADDHPLWAEGLAAMLRGAGASSVRVTTALESVPLALREPPAVDLLVLDMSFGRQSALSAVASLQAASPGTRILVLTAHASHAMAREAIRSGACGYAVKTLPPQEIADLARRIATAPMGELPVTSLGDRKTRILRGTGTYTGPGPSRMQLQVLCALDRVSTQEEAAAVLGLSRKSIEFHLARLRQKTGLSGTPELMTWAREAGYLDPDGDTS